MLTKVETEPRYEAISVAENQDFSRYRVRFMYTLPPSQDPNPEAKLYVGR